MEIKILIVERRRSDSPSFVPGLRKKGFTVDVVTSGIEALEWLTQSESNIMIINAASLKTNGKRICKSIHEEHDSLPIIVILDEDQEFGNPDPLAREILHMPFTVRKLVNKIHLYLKSNPENLVKAGPITLDVEKKTVQSNNRESKLTPRLTELMLILIEKRGEIISRDELFTHVWKTQYTGDTRTLDVHISWLREAIERNPRAPEYLRTVRGVGYRLDW